MLPFMSRSLVIAVLLASAVLGCGQRSAAPASQPTSPPSPASAPQRQTIEPPADAGAQALDAAPRVFGIVPEESEASYDVQEKLAFLPLPSRAVGRTNAIQGHFTLTLGAASRVDEAQFSVDLRTLTSDQNRRDQLIRTQWLESNTYPMAEFRATRVEPLPIGYVEGHEVPVRITGNMTIRTTTRELTFDTRASMQGDTIRGTATTFLLMRDFGFEPPSIANAVLVEDGVNLTVSFTARSEG
jgi:polyisoprenoid-binding protein YceI